MLGCPMYESRIWVKRYRGQGRKGLRELFFALDLEADSPTDRVPTHILSKAISTHQVDALGEIKMGAGVELETCAEGKEMAEPQGVLLIPDPFTPAEVPGRL
jgi:hypothetical protein